jgi:hypothetical protein
MPKKEEKLNTGRSRNTQKRGKKENIDTGSINLS